jgi:hypothetical protein
MGIVPPDMYRKLYIMLAALGRVFKPFALVRLRWPPLESMLAF